VSNAEVNLLLSRLLFYSLNDVSLAVGEIKKCLHHDPEHKLCKKEFRMFKSADKTIQQVQNHILSEGWQEVVHALIDNGFLQQVNDQISQLKNDGQIKPNSPNRLVAQLEEWTCQAYSHLKQSTQAQKHCDIALTLNPESVPALLAKSQVLLTAESYDEAINLLQKANELTGGRDQKVRAQLDRAHRLLQQSKKKDYYKILGVPRDADQKDIKKAYREMSKKFHPDKYRGDLDPDAVSRKMAEINSAYEVLSNEGISPVDGVNVELRTQYDNGHDPNDQEGQRGWPGGQPFVFQQGMPNFFFQNGKPFQGGQNFKFHYGHGHGHNH
jgi:DnaJ homolog subfamily C member 3